MSEERDTQKKDYSKIEAKNNMQVDNNGEEVVDVNASKVDRPRPKKVLAEPPKKRKQGLMERLVKGFLGPEGLPGIGAYLNEEIIVPSIKNIIVEAVTSGINMAIFGERGRPTGGNKYHSSFNGTRTTYRPETQYHTTRTSRHTSELPPPSRREIISDIRYHVTDYPIANREVANDALVNLTEYADKYNYASVADYYDILGVESTHTDYNYGWQFDDLAKYGGVIRLRDGSYLLDLPPVETL